MASELISHVSYCGKERCKVHVAQTLIFCLGTAVVGMVKSYQVVLESYTPLQRTRSL